MHSPLFRHPGESRDPAFFNQCMGPQENGTLHQPFPLAPHTMTGFALSLGPDAAAVAQARLPALAHPAAPLLRPFPVVEYYSDAVETV